MIYDFRFLTHKWSSKTVCSYPYVESGLGFGVCVWDWFLGLGFGQTLGWVIEFGIVFESGTLGLLSAFWVWCFGLVFGRMMFQVLADLGVSVIKKCFFFTSTNCGKQHTYKQTK